MEFNDETDASNRDHIYRLQKNDEMQKNVND